MNNHKAKLPIKKRYFYGIELVECECGVWKLSDKDLPCWSGTGRRQTTAEAFAQLNQAARNLGYQILKSLRLIKEGSI